MDSLSKLLLDVAGQKKTASTTVLPVRELDLFEKRAYGIAMSDMCRDESWLSQFEGTPLAPQAVALAEQELAMEQQQLQKRMQRVAERQNQPDYEQDCIAQDGIRLQKQRLLLELYKMKAMTPTPKPGDAEIGQPEIPNAASLGGGAPGAAGGAPVEEVTAPKTAGSKLGNLIESMARTGWNRAQPMVKGFGRTVAATAKTSGDLSEKQRDDLGKGEFALPGKKKYPIPDEAHARNALARASQFASKGEQSTIRAAVDKKFPGVKLTEASKPAKPTVGLHHVPEKHAEKIASFAKGLLKGASHPLDMPAGGAKWDEQAYEDLLTHGDDPRVPAVARKAILQHHINKAINAQLHTPEEALSEAQSHGKWTGGALGALGGLGLGGTIGALTGYPGTGLAVGGIGGGLLGAHLGKKHMGTPEKANKNIESAKKFQEAMRALHGDEAGQERTLGEMLGSRLKGLEGHEGTY